MVETIVVLVIAAIFFAIGKVRSDIVALCALITLMLLGILTPEEALSGFSNSVVIMLVGLFVVAGAICQTGLAKMISARIMKFAGTSEIRLFILVILVTSVIGAFVSTGTVALMLPIVVSIASKSRVNESRLLLPLAYACSMGGMLTLIGSPPNLVIQDILTTQGYKPLSFFSFTPIGAVCIFVAIIVLLPLSKLLIKKDDQSKSRKRKGKSLEELVQEYRLEENLTKYVVGHNSLIKGKTIAELDIRNRYGLTILEVRKESRRRKGIIRKVNQKLAGPRTQLHEHDIIYLSGELEQAERFAKDYLLEPYQTSSNESTESTLDFYDIGIAEILMLPASQFVGRLMKETEFRSKYNINVVGIRRKGEYITEGLASVRLHSGDVLLVQGTWANIMHLGTEENEWVVLGQPLEDAANVTLDYKAPLAAFILVLMVLAMVFDFIPIAPVTAVMIAAVLMVITGCFRNVEAAYKTINWESVVLIAAMMPMSVALEKTGASRLVSSSLVSGLGVYGPYVLLAGIYYTTSLMTVFISNTATSVLMAPIAMSSALELGLSPYAFLLAVAVSATMCFVSPFSTPPNALVMQAGRYRFMDYIKVGLPLQIIMGIAMIFFLPLLFPF